MDNGTVSVIITTRNEETHIGRCLESIRNQSYPRQKIEVIVVDNHSTDKTTQISREYTDKVYSHGPERSAQRNLGLKNAAGEYVLYLDADMILSNGVICECVEECECQGCTALYIPERIMGEGFWIRVRDFERGFYEGTCIDCVRFIRRDKALEIGGFDENLTGPEDWDFDRRIKLRGRAAIINAPIYHNEGGFRLKSYLSKKHYYTRWMDSYVRKWGRDDWVIKKQLGFYYRYFGVFWEKGKWQNILRHPVLSGAMYSLRIAVGINYSLQRCRN